MTEWDLIDRLGRYRQDHIIRHYQSLADGEKALFRENIADLDLDLIFRLYDQFSGTTDTPVPLPELTPPSVITAPQTAIEIESRDKARSIGESLLRTGKAAVLIVAGGQASRLGFGGPKGAFPISPVRNKSLFQLFAEQVVALKEKYVIGPPLLIMTSPENHGDTVAFFSSNNYFGLDPSEVFFFQQALLPSITPSGDLLLKDRLKLYVNPDGHGGSLKALNGSGLLSKLEGMGITEIFYCQVDNPLVRIADPVFLGYHAIAGAEVSTKVVRRVSVTEKVGIYAKVAGRDRIVEYSEMGDALMAKLDENGMIMYWAGNTAIHVFSLALIKRLNDGGFALPCHLAAKDVDAFLPGRSTQTIKAWKFETFVFDAIPVAARTCAMEVLRHEEFSPVKNASGEDSPETARAAMTGLFRDWFADAGMPLPPATKAEVGPLFALTRDDFLRRKDEVALPSGSAIYLG
jgi:UDP-N-acetylglucosamine/UDP-N-acetylgalactosamine diphosphorylase